MSEVHGNTSGHLLLVQMRLALINTAAPVISATLELSLHLYNRTTSVTLEVPMLGSINSTTQILFGMAQAVVPTVGAVASTTHPGSVNNYHSQPLMTLR